MKCGGAEVKRDNVWRTARTQGHTTVLSIWRPQETTKRVASYERERVASTYAGVEEKGDDDVEELGELLGAQRVHDLDVRRQLGVDLLLAAHEACHGSASSIVYTE